VGAMIQSPFGLLASVVSSSSGAVWCDLICVSLCRSASEMRLMKGSVILCSFLRTCLLACEISPSEYVQLLGFDECSVLWCLNCRISHVQCAPSISFFFV
jgi:hypothetical protein